MGKGRYEHGNALVDGLPAADRTLVAAGLSVFVAEVPSCIVAQGEPYDELLFPIDALFSTAAELSRGEAYEVAATGRLGVVGADVALGVSTAPRSVLSQISGRSARMPRAYFQRCLEESRAFARSVRRHMARRLFIAEQFVACNFAHDLTQRCARWMLMLHDETGREEFELRAEFLGMMLGLQPAQAAGAAAPLARAGAITYAGEVFAMLDRDRLLAASCECYQAQAAFAP